MSTALPGLKPAFEAFLCFALTMSLVSLAGVSLAFLVSASVSSFAMANILIALPFVFMMVRQHNKHTEEALYAASCCSCCSTFPLSSWHPSIVGLWGLSCQSQWHAELALLAEMD